MMPYLKKLMEHGRAYITETELQQIIRERDYLPFHRTVEGLVSTSVLTPVKSSGMNGRLPPLSNKYKIHKPPEDYTGYLLPIHQLNPALNISSYLQRPELYKKHIGIVDPLSKYLWYSANLLEQPMSRKERSFSIWGREKLLDENFALVREVLKFSCLGEDFLNFYDTPEPFFEYVHARRESMTVLILENKDTWFTFRKLMQETEKHIIAGTPVDVLLYGEGNKISKQGALEEYNTEMLRGKAGQAAYFLYFGDLDCEGIRLFFRAREANPGLDIRPFSRLYLLALELSQDVELPRSFDKRSIETPVEAFAEMLGLNNSEKLTGFLQKGSYIPQEIVNYQVISGILS
ncbi:MAG: hypothetical protein ACYCX4_03065 [Bacillota bacterium]